VNISIFPWESLYNFYYLGINYLEIDEALSTDYKIKVIEFHILCNSLSLHTAGGIYSSLSVFLPISRLFARSLLTCDSAMSARSSASSSSCWILRNFVRLTLDSSSWG